MLNAHASRNERLSVSLVLGVGLFASYVMLQPLLLDSFDELAHVGTLANIFDSRAVFPTNSVLPVSPYYPGLELATAATKWLTGLPLVVCQLVVLTAVRVVLVLGIFLIVERACHSERAGGIGVLVYAASPQFYAFDAQYAYETIGLAFAVGAVYLLFFSVDSPRPRLGKAFLLALGAVVAVVLSHHVTGWLTVSFLVVWTVGLYYTSHPFRRWRLARWLRGRWQLARQRPAPGSSAIADTGRVEDSGGIATESSGARAIGTIGTAGMTGVSGVGLALDPEGPNGQGPAEPPVSPGSGLQQEGNEQLERRRRTQASVVGVATLLGLVVGGAWTVYVGRLLTPYLGPVFSAAAADIREALGSGHGNRTLFNAPGAASPHWEIALILLSAVAWCVILLFALYSVVFKRTVRGGILRLMPAVIAALYPLSLLANISSSSKTVAERATTFIFFGVALVVGAWLAGRLAATAGSCSEWSPLSWPPPSSSEASSSASGRS